MICDLAEEYGIYDYRSYPPRFIATLVSGFRTDSRVLTKMNGLNATASELLEAQKLDALNMIMWLHTKDAIKGKNRPKSMTQKLFEKPREKRKGFDTIDEFNKARLEIING